MINICNHLQTEIAVAQCTFLRISGKWFWGILGVTCVFIFLVSGFSGPDPERQLLSNRDNIFMIINFISVLLIIAVSATEIPRDVSTSLIMIILSKPLERYQLIVGKFLGVAVIGISFIVICCLAGTVALWFNGLSPDSDFVKMAGLAIMRGILITAMALLFASNLSEVPTMIFAVVYAAAAHTLPYVLPIFKSTSIPMAVKYIIGFLVHLIPNLSTFSLPKIHLENVQGAKGGLSFEIQSLGQALPPDWSHYLLTCCYVLMYTFVLLAVSIMFFRRRVIA